MIKPTRRQIIKSTAAVAAARALFAESFIPADGETVSL